MKKSRFLTLSDVIIIYQNQISFYGGEYGIRDLNLLSSAIVMAETSFSGKYVHEDILHMADAYAYHIC
jgi:death-on-curing protein